MGKILQWFLSLPDSQNFFPPWKVKRQLSFFEFSYALSKIVLAPSGSSISRKFYLLQYYFFRIIFIQSYNSLLIIRIFIFLITLLFLLLIMKLLIFLFFRRCVIKIGRPASPNRVDLSWTNCWREWINFIHDYCPRISLDFTAKLFRGDQRRIRAIRFGGGFGIAEIECAAR